MKVLVTGGAGDMGRHACRTLVEDEVIDHVVVADRDGARARLMARELGESASALALDIADERALGDAARDVEIVLNTVGPFFRYGRPVLEAAIAAGSHYADINDDWEPTLEMLELSDRAVTAGVIAVVGMGASPGISNLLAAIAMTELDHVERIITGWRAGAGLARPTADDPNPRASAAVEHWVHQCAEPIRIWRDGGFRNVDALEELTISYPGRGEGRVWTCGHPEAVTFPTVQPRAEECVNVMVSRPGLIQAMERIVARVRSAELDVNAGARMLLVEPDIRGPAAGEPAPFPDLFALVEGSTDRRLVRVGASLKAFPGPSMGEITGIPLAVIATMIARGEISKLGVHAPEAIVDPSRFFERLEAFSAPPPEGGPVAVVRELVR